ncbi:MAG: hypothetical protein ACJ8GK_05405 [Luteimonas sp.]
MNAITLLTDDHKKVRALLAQLAGTTNRAEKTSCTGTSRAPCLHSALRHQGVPR